MMGKIVKKNIILFKNIWKNVCIEKNTNISLKTSFGGNNRIGKNSFFSGEIGFSSYIGPNCSINAYIGNYCSISSNVKTILGKHPTREFVSTSPIFYSRVPSCPRMFANVNKFKEHVFVTYHGKEYPVVIENDVWIGADVLILEGVIINNGAIVGAGSIVTKDVPPFSIVAGSPAKVIGYRFSKDIINKLEKIKWWSWDENKILQYCNCFNDVKTFISNYYETE